MTALKRQKRMDDRIMDKTIQKFTILSISLLSMAVTAASPALGDISKAFPDTRQNIIMLIVSLPALLIIPFTLICGKLSSIMSKRKLLFIGLILFIIGGVSPSFSNSITFILGMRAVLGIGVGFIMPLATGLIADFYHGEELAAMMGLQSAFVNVGAIITSLIAGFLSVINWHYTFFVYVCGIGVLLLTFFKLPEPEKTSHSNKEKPSLSISVYVISFLLLIYGLFLFSFFTNTAMVITGENLGNAASAGVAITMMTVGGLIAGIFFGKVSQALKRFTLAASVILTGIGFIMLSYSHNYHLILAAAVMSGIGFGTTMPTVMIKVSNLAPKDAATFAIAIATSAMSLGQFLSPLVLSWIGQLAGNGSGRFSFLLSGVGILIGGLLLLVQARRLEMRPSNAVDGE